MIYSREGMRHQCWSLVIVSTERGRQVGDVVLHHGLPRSGGSPVYRRGHGESVFACASTLVRRGEYRAQTGIWRLLGFVSARTIKGRSSWTGLSSSPPGYTRIHSGVCLVDKNSLEASERLLFDGISSRPVLLDTRCNSKNWRN
jgi:hypothetical protein